jgi:pimeloyl-[acyl-carrier protein] methyl ester esterase
MSSLTAKEPNISTNGAKVRLILLPGLDGAGLAFGPLLKLLPSFIQPTVVTYPKDQVMGYQQLLPFVMGMLPNDPFVLLGESFSSPLSITIAALRPPGLRGLILSSAFARNPIWLAPNWLAPLTRPFIFRLYNPYIRLKVWWRGGGPSGQARLAAISGLLPEVVANRARSALLVNVLEKLPAVQTPVMYIRGDRDKLVHSRCLTEMAECMPTMRVVRIDGGHCVLRSQAELAAAAIAEFVEHCQMGGIEVVPTNASVS